MRAFAVQRFGEMPAIHNLPVPTVDGAFHIGVRYAGVNPIDYKLRKMLTASSTYPFIMGADFAGVVEGVPAGQRDFNIGDRIFGMARRHGAYADFTAVMPGVETEPLARIPDGVTDEQAAALPIAAVTALGSLDLLGVTTGERLVVLGAGNGGVGGYAVQMAALPAALTLLRSYAAMLTKHAASVLKKYTITKPSRCLMRCARPTPDGVDALVP